MGESKRSLKEKLKDRQSVCVWLPRELCQWAKQQAEQTHRGNFTWFMEDALKQMKKQRK